jgi:hypothetical protein
MHIAHCGKDIEKHRDLVRQENRVKKNIPDWNQAILDTTHRLWDAYHSHIEFAINDAVFKVVQAVTDYNNNTKKGIIMSIQKIHTYEYDAEGRETKATIEGTSVGDTLKILKTIETERDADGNIIKVTETEWPFTSFREA